MKLLLVLALSLFSHTAKNNGNDKVLICKGNSSYAYHSGNCKGLQQCRASIEKVTIEEAKRLKRKACNYCYGNSSASSSNSFYDSGTNTSQCKAITKKGTRCSRNAKSGGYCWQHE